MNPTPEIKGVIGHIMHNMMKLHKSFRKGFVSRGIACGLNSQ